MNKKLLKIFSYYGDKHQLKKLKEEQKELRQAISLYQKKNKYSKGVPEEVKRHLIDELADNFVLLGQFINGYEVDNETLTERMKFKIKRTIDEMGHERKGR